MTTEQLEEDQEISQNELKPWTNKKQCLTKRKNIILLESSKHLIIILFYISRYKNYHFDMIKQDHPVLATYNMVITNYLISKDISIPSDMYKYVTNTPPDIEELTVYILKMILIWR